MGTGISRCIHWHKDRRFVRILIGNIAGHILAPNAEIKSTATKKIRNYSRFPAKKLLHTIKITGKCKCKSKVIKFNSCDS